MFARHGTRGTLVFPCPEKFTFCDKVVPQKLACGHKTHGSCVAQNPSARREWASSPARPAVGDAGHLPSGSRLRFLAIPDPSLGFFIMLHALAALAGTGATPH